MSDGTWDAHDRGECCRHGDKKDGTADLLKKINELIDQARKCEKDAEELLAKALPPGTVVTFKFGRMTSTSYGEVISTDVHRWPEVRLRNIVSNKMRRVPLDAVKGY